MARFDTSFDASGIEPRPATMCCRRQVCRPDRRERDAGDQQRHGQFLWLMLDILEGPHKGRRVFDQLNLVNQNPTTVEIAQRALSAICHATAKCRSPTAKNCTSSR